MQSTVTNLPVALGLGLKMEHLSAILARPRHLGFFEIHAENYMVAGGPLHHYLTQVRERYPLSLHGVALSIGGESPLDQAHLRALRELIKRYQPASFSEHLAWSTHGDYFLNDLLPLPYHQATLDRVCAHIDQTQDFLGQRMLLENPASYLEFTASTMTETDFIRAVIQRTGCGLLLDVNNVYVSCVNHHHDPHEYLRALPLTAVGEIHLAGFATQMDSCGDRLLIDHHGTPIAAAVWALYREVLSLIGPQPTLIERDNDIPAYEVLLTEVQTAQTYLNQAITMANAPVAKALA